MIPPTYIITKKALEKQLEVPALQGKKFFVTTKLYPNQFENAEAAIDEALDKLDIGYIDLMLLHHRGIKTQTPIMQWKRL